MNIESKDKNIEINESRKDYLDVFYTNSMRPPSNYPEKLAAYLKKTYLSKSGKLVDLGCGRGDMLRAFHSIGYEVCGTDLSPSSKRNCAPHPVEIVDLQNNKTALASSSFDVVFSKSVIEHLQDPIPFLENARDLLSEDGKAIFLTPSWVHHGWGPFYLDHTHVTPFTKPSLRDAMILAGYKNIKVYYFYQLPSVWRFPFLKIFAKIVAALPIPYSPMYDTYWSNAINKYLRFSNEVMLLAVASR